MGNKPFLTIYPDDANRITEERERNYRRQRDLTEKLALEQERNEVATRIYHENQEHIARLNEEVAALKQLLAVYLKG